MTPTALRTPRSWADVAYLFIEQFKSQLVAFVGFPLVVATLLGAWHFLRPDLHAISDMVTKNAEITANQASISRDQIVLMAELREAIKEMRTP